MVRVGKVECCIGDCGMYHSPGKELSCFSAICYKSTTTLRKVTRGKNLGKNGNVVAGAQTAAVPGEVREPACACGRGQFAILEFHFFGDKSKSISTRVHCAPLSQFYYTEKLNKLMCECDACRLACE